MKIRIFNGIPNTVKYFFWRVDPPLCACKRCGQRITKFNNNYIRGHENFGRVSWNKGIPMRIETKNKVSQSKLKNPTRYWLGKSIPKYMRDKIRITLTGKTWEDHVGKDASIIRKQKQGSRSKKYWAIPTNREKQKLKMEIVWSNPDYKLDLIKTFNSDECLRKRIKDYDKWIIDEPKRDQYRREVWKETRRWINELVTEWNGHCFYTGELLKRGETKRTPTIDHKIPISVGFLNQIPARLIGTKCNLCICSRSVNSQKHTRVFWDGYMAVKEAPRGFWFRQQVGADGHPHQEVLYD